MIVCWFALNYNTTEIKAPHTHTHQRAERMLIHIQCIHNRLVNKPTNAKATANRPDTKLKYVRVYRINTTIETPS